MATNGNTRSESSASDPRLEALENTLRGVQSLQPAASSVVAAGAGPREGGDEPIYDLAAHATGTAKALRDLAEYSNNVAGDIERIVASYITNMGRLMGNPRLRGDRDGK